MRMHNEEVQARTSGCMHRMGLGIKGKKEGRGGGGEETYSL